MSLSSLIGANPKLKMCFFALYFIFTAKVYAQVQVQSFPIPDPQTYSDFLVKPWQANQASLITFKDPRCPHCAKALKKIARLDNYNVFVFWAPILGEQSQQIVDEIFRCEQLTSDEVFTAVSARKSPKCSGMPNVELRALNDSFVEAYNPRSVPQYWLGGARVQVANLNLAQTKAERIASLKESAGLQIPWHRYTDLSVTPTKRGLYNAALVLPNATELNDFFRSTLYTDSVYKWHVIESNDANQNQEFLMLTNLMDISSPTVLVEGQILTRSEMDSLLSSAFMKNFNNLRL